MSAPTEDARHTATGICSMLGASVHVVPFMIPRKVLALIVVCKQDRIAGVSVRQIQEHRYTVARRETYQ